MRRRKEGGNSNLRFTKRAHSLLLFGDPSLSLLKGFTSLKSVIKFGRACNFLFSSKLGNQTLALAPSLNFEESSVNFHFGE